MRVVQLAAGAANMICGSCLRDNRLAATLRAAGRDVLLLPLYTPLRTDEPSVAESSVHFGGVNVYLSARGGILSQLPRFARRWLDHPALLRGVGRLATRTSPSDLGALTVSMLRGAEGPHRAQARELSDQLRRLDPRIVCLPNLLFAGLAPTLRDALPKAGLVCTLSGEDLFIDGLPSDARERTLELIRRQARDVDLFLATSDFYRRRCIEFFGLPDERVRHVPLGVEHRPAPRAQEPPRPFTIAFLGRIAPEKGLLEAADALIALHRGGHDARLRAGGWLADAAYLAQIEAKLVAAGCRERFEYLGELTRDQKYELLADAHAFTMPSRYPEAKGLPIIEALGEGVPVVQPATGSFPEMMERTGGGILYDPTDSDGLANGLARLLSDPDLRRELGRRGAAGAREHYSHWRMADETWRHYEELAR